MLTVLRPQLASLPTLAEQELFAQAGWEATEVISPAGWMPEAATGQWLQQGLWLKDHSSALIFLVSAGISCSGHWETIPTWMPESGIQRRPTSSLLCHSIGNYS